MSHTVLLKFIFPIFFDEDKTCFRWNIIYSRLYNKKIKWNYAINSMTKWDVDKNNWKYYIFFFLIILVNISLCHTIYCIASFYFFITMVCRNAIHSVTSDLNIFSFLPVLNLLFCNKISLTSYLSSFVITRSIYNVGRSTSQLYI